MTQKKAKRGGYSKRLFFLTFLIVVITSISLLAIDNKTKMNTFTNIQNSIPLTERPMPTEQQYPLNVVNDGIYTNYKHGFKLKYPEDLFVKYEISDSQSVDFYTSENLSTPDIGEQEKYPNDIFFSILAFPADDMVYKFSQEDYERSIKYRSQVGITNYNYDVLFRNLEIIEKKERKIAINYMGADLYTTENIKKFKLDSDLATTYPQTYGYIGIILTDAFGINISFRSAKKNLVDTNFVTFKKLINSLELFPVQQ
jgi:hypothetical protein